MKNVFISFSSSETTEATRICNYLEENGISCFISTRDLIPGKEYAQQLLSNMDQVKAVVLLLSNASNDSPHVLREIEYAVSHKIPILVYKLEEVTLSKSMEYFLMTHQWITDSKDKDQSLLDGIRNLLKNETKDNDSAPKEELFEKELGSPNPDLSTSSEKKSPKKRPLLIGAIAVLLIAGILLGTILLKSAGILGQKKPVITYELGDTVTFGSYYGEPIEWRVLKINEDGTMVLLSKYILTIKSFDAPEGGEYNHYEGNEYWSYDNHIVTDESLVIKIRGNNDWSLCNLRTWLNSDTEVVKYPDQEPTYKAVGDNFYCNEPGFLYEFTEEEKAALVTVTNQSPANTFSENATDGYVTSEERVYLLSSEELSWIDEAGMIMYAKPTAACEEHDAYRAYYEDFVEAYHTESFYWWLRDNPKEEINKVYVAVTEYESDMTVAPANCGASDYGVRPVVTVDASSKALKPLE